ncbi:lipase [Lophiostoma macrostomum CBS 122681]|uniref:Lipase n=1 Tax=Lophiostoma macrostomum CBS 122681 TaxID=1314788 RepID=A0A6A6SW30_9PLEO|nr:lipase [Lophiostoma macrostomum CBS 122681]
MISLPKASSALCYLFATALSNPVASPFQTLNTRASSQPIAPSEDPWYTAPTGFETTTPGTILRIREAPGNATSLVANCSAVYNILFRSTDANYEPTFGVTTLFVPSKDISSPGNSSSSASLLSLQIAYNSADVDASPSYSLYTGLTQPALGAPATSTDVGFALSNGWHVSIVDFEGPHASFGLGPQAGHAVLDAVRAVLSSSVFPSADASSTTVAMWGYSGGSIATEFAAEFQEQYAPELDFAGIAIGGIVTNVTNVIHNINGGPFAGLLPGVLLGVTSQDAEARAYLVSKLKEEGPTNKSYFLEDLHLNVNGAFAAYPNVSVFDFFDDGESDVFAPILQNIFNRNSYMGAHGVPRIPVFAYKAIGDEFTDIEQTDALFSWYCSVGARIWFQRNEVGGHVDEIVNGRERALEWLKTVFDGSYVAGGCLTENVRVNTSSLGY